MSLVRVERPRRLALLVGAVVLLVAAGSAVAWSVTANRGDVDDLLPNLTQAVPERAERADGRHGRRPAVLPRLRVGRREPRRRAADRARPAGPASRSRRWRSGSRSGAATARCAPCRCARRSGTSAPSATRTGTCSASCATSCAPPDGVRGRAATGRPASASATATGSRSPCPDGRPNARYSDRCGRGAPGLQSIREGISIGWGDNYLAHLEGQELEITSLAAGRYVLVHRVNPNRDLRESDYTDNVASMAIDLDWPRGQQQPPRIDVVARCPGTATCPLEHSRYARPMRVSVSPR